MKVLSLVFAFFCVLSQSIDALDNNSKTFGDDRQLLSSIIEFADKIQNAVPTVPTTPPPTALPTYSSVPSPSPSATPTLSPTLSMAPSVSPTIAPTVSAEPTNHPTVSPAPSTSPSTSPTNQPSVSPSESPTNFPTVSAAPSSSPSISPTKEPSASPSMSPTYRPSALPSATPTNAPTVSAAPSLIYYMTLRANIFVTLSGVDRKMNATQMDVFESATKMFIQQDMQRVEGAVLVASVVVLDQEVITTKNILKVEIRVVAEYESLVHPGEFDFGATMREGFDTNYSLLLSFLLDSGDLFFVPLDPAYDTNANGFITKGGYITLIVVSILVSMGAICAARYAVQRKKEDHGKGDKLSEMNMYEDAVDSNLTQDDNGITLQHTKSIEIIQVTDGTEHDGVHDFLVGHLKTETPKKKYMLDADKNAIEVDTICGNSRDGSYPGALPSKSNPVMKQIMSPSTMENGRLGALAESIMRNESFGSNRDPPESSGYKYAPKSTKSDPSANYQAAASGLPRPGTAPPSRNQDVGGPHRSSLDSKRDPSVVGAPNSSSETLKKLFLKQEETEEEEFRPVFEKVQSHVGRTRRSHADSSSSILNSSEGVQLTVGRNGMVGAPTTANKAGNANDPRSSRMDLSTSPSSSAVSSSINAFLNMVGGTLGAAPMASPAHKKDEKNQKFHDVLQREGLYDVFAPSGALGIVVDTTKDGPAVHSLKQTSPMLGLINPGDLIVGLDAQDTRSMTAATLTRLMASKSNQKERKITLLASDNF